MEMWTLGLQDHFTKVKELAITFKYIDPTYIIRVVPSNASGGVYYTLLTVSVVHGAMAGYIGHQLYKSSCQQKTNLYTLYDQTRRAAGIFCQ
ncbi:putative 6-phosphofructokinase [Medicago truncatula]|uniref:Putative 6-phosphofructokinase n=1 Tax=Medicago truncatula TaxID=3880 RepID=A0A396I7T1_MEDTR|nr:ATP-dependent 6-phosphofructokinase 4, chloroplastic [Medicago truncatula]RHN60868.1 putative 6-phosphofructokinase [Medicago truncatula]